MQGSTHPGTEPGLREASKRLVQRCQHLDSLATDKVNEQNYARWNFLREKQMLRNYYAELRHQRVMCPGSIYGYGFAGYGNGKTDERVRVQYPGQQRRAGNRRSKELYINGEQATIQANTYEELVPVRLDIEIDKMKLRDTFTWNLHDHVIPVDLFAETLVEDFRIPAQSAGMVAHRVQREIVEQVQDYFPHVFFDDKEVKNGLPYTSYKDDEMRILVKLNITIGQHTLVDRFEWDINNPMNNPEEFARQMARELSLSGEFTTAIAHSIREQSQMFTRSLYIVGHPFDGRPIEDGDLKEGFLPSPLPSVFRPAQAAKDFTPYIFELNENDLQQEELSILREQRRQKRSINRRGGPALPDLKERPRTVRTLLVSEVLPSATSSLECSRLFKIHRTSMRGRRQINRGTGGTEGTDEYGDSNSEDSTGESTTLGTGQIAAQAQNSSVINGNSRTRGVRGAATAATVALRGNHGGSGGNGNSILQGTTSASATSIPISIMATTTTNPTALTSVGGGTGLPGINNECNMRPLTAEKRLTRRGGASSTDKEEEVEESRDRLVVKLRLRSKGLLKAIEQNHEIGKQTGARATGTREGGMDEDGKAKRNERPKAEQDGEGALAKSGDDTIHYLPDGRVDAEFPQPAGGARVPPPPWIESALEQLRRKYVHDMFEGYMRYSAIDKVSNQPTKIDAFNSDNDGSGGKSGRHNGNLENVKFQYLPRIRCLDCPGKLYTPGPGLTVENFEVHLKNRHHRERVELRRKSMG